MAEGSNIVRTLCVFHETLNAISHLLGGFIALEEEEFFFPPDRSEHYTIIEISMFEGRSEETKKDLIRTIFRQFEVDLGLSPQDVEITIHETPKANWGIRGKPGDELTLTYQVEK